MVKSQSVSSQVAEYGCEGKEVNYIGVDMLSRILFIATFMQVTCYDRASCGCSSDGMP